MSFIRFYGTANTQQVVAAGGYVEDDTTYLPIDYVQKFTNSEEFVIIVSEAIRPGIKLFLTKLEYTLFKPGTPENAKLSYGVGQIVKDAALHLIMVFPAVYLSAAEQLAKNCGLQFVKDAPASFPISGSAVYHTYNTPDSKAHHVMLDLSGDYDAYCKRVKDLLDLEDVEINAFLSSNN